MHVDDVRTQIQRALDPTVQEAGGTAATRPALNDEFVDVSVDPESCWLDNAIRARR
jgi:hypothetical protein